MNARRTVVRLTFAGVDISADINKHLLSLTYTDNEEDKTDDLQLLLAGLSVVSTICAIVFGYVAFARNGKKDVADEAKSDATVLTEIGYIKANTDEIKAEQKEQRKTNVEVVTRLTAVEASAKQAHKRLDTFENRERHEHEE